MIKVKQLAQPVLACVIMLFLAACAAGGPSFRDSQATVKPVAADQGRIYFYRVSSIVGAVIQPSIRVEGEVVGSSVPGGYFFIDRAPGTYAISTTTEVTREIEVTVAAGQTVYVRTTIGAGVVTGRVKPVVMEPEKALKELAECNYAPK